MENVGFDEKGEKIWHNIYQFDSYGNKISEK